MTPEFEKEYDDAPPPPEYPVDMIISSRTASIALMFATIHLGDDDCLGDAAAELYAALASKVELPTDFDC